MSEQITKLPPGVVLCSEASRMEVVRENSYIPTASWQFSPKDFTAFQQALNAGEITDLNKVFRLALMHGGRVSYLLTTLPVTQIPTEA